MESKTTGSGWLNLRAAAQYLGISENSLRLRVQRKSVVAHRLGKRLLRFKQSELDALLRPASRLDEGGLYYEK